jgi:DNA-binding PadR family transcriptional regulator
MRNHSEFFGEGMEWAARRLSGRDGNEPGGGRGGPHHGGREGRHAGGEGRHGGGGGRHGGGGFWGFGGGAPFGFPWGGGRRGQRARRGDIRAGILALLAETPRNGYQIMQELEQRSRGMWRPSPGSVYPALQQLEDEGLVKAKEVGTGRVFELTEPGQKYVADNRAETQAPWDWATTEEEEGAHDLMGQLRPIALALTQIVSGGQRDQLVKASKVLKDTRRSLYGILSEDTDEGEE